MAQAAAMRIFLASVLPWASPEEALRYVTSGRPYWFWDVLVLQPVLFADRAQGIELAPEALGDTV